MKRIAPVFLLILLIVFAAGCGNAEREQIREESAEPSVGAEESYISDEDVSETGSGSPKPSQTPEPAAAGVNMNESQNADVMTVKLNVNGTDFNVVLEDNDTAGEFAALFADAPLTIEMTDYGGFEKAGPLGRELTTDNVKMTTQPGDIVLYNGSNIVMFYGSNTWDYTKIGSAEDLDDWKKALGEGDVTAVFG